MENPLRMNTVLLARNTNGISSKKSENVNAESISDRSGIMSGQRGSGKRKMDIDRSIIKTMPWRCVLGHHRWVMFTCDQRVCICCDKDQTFSRELGGWYETEYLSGTNYDGGRHLRK